MPDHAQASLERVLKSGEYVCRPRRRIFVEHELFNAKGEPVRKASRDDILDIAANGNESAERGELAKITLGHTYDDVLDEKGNVVRKFKEEDQPAPIGYLHNYSTSVGTDGKLELFADQWIAKTLKDQNGQLVSGPNYVATFPGRSPEYLRRQRKIDGLALLRRTPALELGMDIVPYAERNPDKVFYRSSGGKLAMYAAEDRFGRVRYGFDEGMAEDDAPAGSPAAPATDKPPIPQSSDELDDTHKTAAERYSHHLYGMHHTQHRTLMHHLHSMYGAACGLPGDKMAPFAPTAGVAPAAPQAEGSMGTPPKEKPSMESKEKERMSADQNSIDIARYASQVTALTAEVAQLRKDREEATEKAMYATFEGAVKQLRMEGRDDIDLVKEVEWCKTRKYSQQQLDDHVAMLKRIPPGSALVTGGFIPVETTAPPKLYGTSDKANYERSLEVQRYANANGCSMDDARKAVSERYGLNGVA